MGSSISYLRGTPGPSGYGSASTAEDVTANMDLSSKTVIITGATSGIGKESARVLAKRGAHCIFAVRNLELGETVKAEFLAETPTARVDVMYLDLSSLKSVREFAETFKAQNLPLNILLNNAGLTLNSFQVSEDGVERTFAVNHLGPFLLTNLLLDTMKATAKETGVEGRIVNVASSGYKYCPKGGVLLDKVNDPKSFKYMITYCQSKLANILHAKELAHRLQDEGAMVTANALHPGGIKTGFGRNDITPFVNTLLDIAFSMSTKILKTIPQGAATSLYVATDPNLEGISGKFFLDCNELPTDTSASNDMELAAGLWTYSEDHVAAILANQTS